MPGEGPWSKLEARIESHFKLLSTESFSQSDRRIPCPVARKTVFRSPMIFLVPEPGNSTFRQFGHSEIRPKNAEFRLFRVSIPETSFQDDLALS